MPANVDPATVEGFGFEWSNFDQRAVPIEELQRYFDRYFAIFPWEKLASDASGFDLGCGSGRWARFVAPRIGELHCIDASARAIDVARRTLAGVPNCRFHVASVDSIPLPDASQDFGYSLGVLHHLPDTISGLKACAAKLKPGAPFLIYVYYALDDRSWAYKALWILSDLLRRVLARLPLPARHFVSFLLAACVYWPLARIGMLLSNLGLPTRWLPLSYYREASFLTMRTDSFDRFATRLERRFRKEEVLHMLQEAGLDDAIVGSEPPYWCAVAFRRKPSSRS